MKITKKTIARIAAAVLLLLLAGVVLHFHEWNEAIETAMNIAGHGYAKALPYEMLSDDLKALVSEEEFLDPSPEGKLRLYRTVGDRIFVKKPFASTDRGKTPNGNFEIFAIGETQYIVQYEIDFDFTVLGLFRPKAVNFRVYIQESEISESSE